MKKSEFTEMARKMRMAPTLSEDIFWQAVRNKRFCGLKFRRQHVIEQFIVDFFVPSYNLVIEIDGDVHVDRKEQDSQREQFLNDRGLRILRFSDMDIEDQLDNVLGIIRTFIFD